MKNGPKVHESSILIGFSIIFTIHFGGFPLFLEPSIWHPHFEGSFNYPRVDLELFLLGDFFYGFEGPMG